jgi:hypothetical protein
MHHAHTNSSRLWHDDAVSLWRRSLLSLCEVEESRRVLERELEESRRLHTEEKASRRAAEEARESYEARTKRSVADKRNKRPLICCYFLFSSSVAHVCKQRWRFRNRHLKYENRVAMQHENVWAYVIVYMHIQIVY